MPIDRAANGPAELAATVYVVDDDAAIRASLALLVRAYGWSARTYDSAEAFLEDYPAGGRGCVVLDLLMPGMNGPDLQAAMKARRIDLPVIVLTALCDHPLAARARSAGAVAVLGKPFSNDDLIGRLRSLLG